MNGAVDRGGIFFYEVLAEAGVEAVDNTALVFGFTANSWSRVDGGGEEL